jgi:hypothetical protein
MVDDSKTTMDMTTDEIVELVDFINELNISDSEVDAYLRDLNESIRTMAPYLAMKLKKMDDMDAELMKEVAEMEGSMLPIIHIIEKYRDIAWDTIYTNYDLRKKIEESLKKMCKFQEAGEERIRTDMLKKGIVLPERKRIGKEELMFAVKRQEPHQKKAEEASFKVIKMNEETDFITGMRKITEGYIWFRDSERFKTFPDYNKKDIYLKNAKEDIMNLAKKCNRMDYVYELFKQITGDDL